MRWQGRRRRDINQGAHPAQREMPGNPHSARQMVRPAHNLKAAGTTPASHSREEQDASVEAIKFLTKFSVTTGGGTRGCAWSMRAAAANAASSCRPYGPEIRAPDGPRWDIRVVVMTTRCPGSTLPSEATKQIFERAILLQIFLCCLFSHGRSVPGPEPPVLSGATAGNRAHRDMGKDWRSWLARPGP